MGKAPPGPQQKKPHRVGRGDPASPCAARRGGTVPPAAPSAGRRLASLLPLAALLVTCWTGPVAAGVHPGLGLYHIGYQGRPADQPGARAGESVPGPALPEGARGSFDVSVAPSGNALAPLAEASGSERAWNVARQASSGLGFSDDHTGTGAGRASRSISPIKAIGASLILPGWGQMLTGHRDRGKLFMVAEAAIAISFVAFRVQGEVRQNRYVDYAELFASVADADGRPDGYYRNLGRYTSSAEYEDELMREARARFGDDIAQREVYVAERMPAPDQAWEWRSQAHRDSYLEMRKDSRNSFRRSDQALGLALLNRVLSAVDAARSARRGEGSAGRALYVRPGPDGTSYVGLSWPLDQ